MSTKIQTAGDSVCRETEKTSINFSLRDKLFILVVVAIALTTIPIITLASRRLSATGFKQGLMLVKDSAEIIEDNINAAYLGRHAANCMEYQYGRNST